MGQECLLCLDVDKDFIHYMNVFGEEWREQTIKTVIEKHLWPVATFKSQSQWLCTACWKELYDFEEFYKRIENVHAYFEHVDRTANIFKNGRRESNNSSSDKSEGDLYALLINPNNDEGLQTILPQEFLEVKKEPSLHEEISEAEVVSDKIPELFKCDYCGKCLKTQKLLFRHTACHRGTICSCEICDLRFFDLSSLIQHKRTHAPKENSLKTTNYNGGTTIFHEANDNSSVTFSYGDFDYMEIKTMHTIANPEDYIKCSHCSKELSQKTMPNHMAWHKKEIYKCQSCDLQFFNKNKYNIHKTTHKRNQKEKVASDENDSGSDGNLNLKFNNQESGFKCKYCSQVYDEKTTYLNHIAWHETNVFHLNLKELKLPNTFEVNKHISNQNLQSIDTCDTENGLIHFFEESQQDTNQEIFDVETLSVTDPPKLEDKQPQELSNDPTETTLVQENTETQEKDDVISQMIEIECTVCCKPVETERVLLNHIAWHRQIVFACNLCDLKFFDYSVYEQHINAHSAETPKVSDEPKEEPFQYIDCSICSKVLKSRRIFLNHNAWHLQAIYKCEICDLQFLDKTKFEDHKDTHLPKSWKRCRDCGKVFATPANVKAHWDKIHRNKFIKICDICGMMYRCPLAFKRHHGKHMGLTLPKTPCDICGRLLKGINSMRAHKFIHHPKNGILPYSCHICLQPIATRSLLNRHITLRHSENNGSIHKCTICDKTFKSKTCFKDHIDAHNSVAKYSCQWCTKAFYRSAYLSRHRKKVHPNEYKEWQSQLFVKI